MTDEQHEKQFVYIVQCNELNKVKIGRTNNPELRIKSLQVGSPAELHLVATIECDPIRETVLHRAFESVHSHGEWFNTSPEAVIELAKKLTDNRAVTRKLLSLSTSQLTDLCNAYGAMSVGECFVFALNDKDALSKIRQIIIHGGSRIGSGRKSIHGERKVQMSVVVTPEVKAYLGTCENQSETIEKAVRQSKQFKEWKAKGK